MAGEAQDSNWPLPKFYFSVDWGSTTDIPFQEVSGLEIEAQPIEYRHGNSPVFSTINMPGIIKNSHVTMKKGVFVNDNAFWDWYNQIKMNTIERQNVVIKLLDESGSPTMTWTLNNAWPSKISSTDLKSDANEVAVESIEISHEGLTITNG
ncbi:MULTISPECIES: phage tail protein [Mongoliibacter]|jgi:phage tail-like protein|uniref:Phage tail-like protein n=1 Tax=Mongoliibacter ruber TaxID=1750599 RepID=A0A2T0WVJ6_9BACT|nr:MULTISPECIES: phage tail protein [Mongoliibacter]PRY90718.1 phage tail-like protein [Mongoliibacter ruber]TVP46486.1 MAG: phage tail protein [Mongoliibacter sp.]